jgi:uncharacterized protein (TIRG00374 family)
MPALRIGLGIGISILFALLLLRNVDLRQAARNLTMLGPATIAACVALVLAGYSARAWRWQIMLRGASVDASYRQVAPIFFAGFALNNVLPLRAGDLYRCVSTARLTDGTIAKSLATLITERLLDLAGLTLLLCVLVILVPQADLAALSVPIAILLIAGLILTLLLVLSPIATWRTMETWFGSWIARFRFTARAARWIRSLAEAAEGTLSGGSRWPAIGLTGVAWLLELGVFIVIGSHLRGDLVLAGGLYAGTLGTLATLIPGAPGHFGTFDFFASQGFQYGGLSAETALAAAVASHLVILAPVTLLGSFRLIFDRQAGLNASG